MRGRMSMNPALWGPMRRMRLHGPERWGAVIDLPAIDVNSPDMPAPYDPNGPMLGPPRPPASMTPWIIGLGAVGVAYLLWRK
jgi:hypothetical protein